MDKPRIKHQKAYGNGDSGDTEVASGRRMRKSSIFCELVGETETVSARTGWLINEEGSLSNSIRPGEDQMKLINMLQDCMNSLAASVYYYFEDPAYQPPDGFLAGMELLIDNLRDYVGDGQDFTQWGNGGLLELRYNDTRVAVRQLERVLCKFSEVYPVRVGAPARTLDAYMTIINRASFWLYWSARAAGKRYRLEHGGSEQFWVSPSHSEEM